MNNISNIIKSLDTKTLLALFNKLTGKATSKFASRDRGEAQTLKAAEAHDNLEAILIEMNIIEAPKAAAPAKAEKAEGEKKARRGTNLLPPGHAPIACREGSKQAVLLDTLARPNGATMAELIDALSGGNKPWTEATVRSGFGWDMRLKGYGVRSSFDADGTERFHIVVPEGHAIPAHRPLKSAPKADARQARRDV
jgi:hypothetical protein